MYWKIEWNRSAKSAIVSCSVVNRLQWHAPNSLYPLLTADIWCCNQTIWVKDCSFITYWYFLFALLWFNTFFFRHHAYIGEVKILIPRSWNISNSTPAQSETYGNSNFKIKPTSSFYKGYGVITEPQTDLLPECYRGGRDTSLFEDFVMLLNESIDLFGPLGKVRRGIFISQENKSIVSFLYKWPNACHYMWKWQASCNIL